MQPPKTLILILNGMGFNLCQVPHPKKSPAFLFTLVYDLLRCSMVFPIALASPMILFKFPGFIDSTDAVYRQFRYIAQLIVMCLWLDNIVPVLQNGRFI